VHLGYVLSASFGITSCNAIAYFESRQACTTCNICNIRSITLKLSGTLEAYQHFPKHRHILKDAQTPKGCPAASETRSLVIGHWSLVIGHWSLVIGHWSLAIGYWLLTFGYWIALKHSRAFKSPLNTLEHLEH
jgi:hypothetical protein